MQQVQNIQEKRNASIQEIDNKNIFSQTYVLYNENGMVKPTFVSGLNQEMNVFSEFTIFREKTIKKQKYSQETTTKIFYLRRYYTGQKKFSFTLRKLDRSPEKCFSDIISLSFIIRPKKKISQKKNISKSKNNRHLYPHRKSKLTSVNDTQSYLD